MDNQVGSINFDANNLYLEEDSEHEDDKQQDNEIKELISQGGLDGILDDDSLISSSADSSYDDTDNSESGNHNNLNTNPQRTTTNNNNNQPSNHHHHNHHNSNHPNHRHPTSNKNQIEKTNDLNPKTNLVESTNLIGADIAVESSYTTTTNNNNNNNNFNGTNGNENKNQIYSTTENANITTNGISSSSNNNNNNNNPNENENNKNLFSPMHNQVNHTITATPLAPHPLNAVNYLKNDYRNQFSTPSTNQNPPPPQILQATVIPNVNEDKLFYRQRNLINGNVGVNGVNSITNKIMGGTGLVDTMDELIPKFQQQQQPSNLIQQQYQSQQQQQQQVHYLLNDNDQTIASSAAVTMASASSAAAVATSAAGVVTAAQLVEQQRRIVADNGAKKLDDTELNQQNDLDFNNEHHKFSNQYEQRMNAANYIQIQQQHFISHTKLHSLDRFGMPTGMMMPHPATQRPSATILAEINRHHHENLANDHELSLNETDNEDENPFKTTNQIENKYKNNSSSTNKILTSNANKIPIAAFGNGVQLELTTGNLNDNHKNIDNNELKQQQQLQQQQQHQQQHPYEDQTSIIDLNELDEAQLKQLQAEEEKQQQEYFNIDHLNRLYCQAQFLYKVRGKKLEEVTNRFTTYQEDMAREMRAMKHRVYLAEKEKESLQTSIDQAHELCQKYKAESDLNKKNLNDLQEKYDKLKQTNRSIELKLADNEQEIENLHLQLSEQQKLDTLERIQEQHEHFIEQLRDKYEKEIFQLKEKLSEVQTQLNEKHEIVHMLHVQLDASNKNAEMAAVDRADTINRLTKSLNELQAKYDQDIIIAGLNNKSSKNSDIMGEDVKSRMEQLSERCRDLEQQLRLHETLKLNHSTTQIMSANSTSNDFHLSLANSTSTNPNPNTNSNNNNDAVVISSLQNELERALASLKQKRIEMHKYQMEIERLKTDLNRNQSNNENEQQQKLIDDNEYYKQQKEEMIRLSNLVDELQREKIDLTNDLIDKNTKLDQLMEQEERLQLIKNNLELEMYNKQEHINECEKLIEKLHASSQEVNQLNAHQNQMYIKEYEAQLAELKLKLTNREHEIQKTREMYIEVCNEKNNLEENLKVNYDKEYEIKLKQRLDLAISDRIEEQKNYLKEKWSQEREMLKDEYRKQIELNLKDLNQTRERLSASEKQYDQLRIDKADMEIKYNRIESELREKCYNFERSLKENEDKYKNDLSGKEKELDSLRVTMKRLNDEHLLDREEKTKKIEKLESLIDELRIAHDKEKQTLLESIEKLINERDFLKRERDELNEQLNAADLKQKETETIRVKELNVKIKEFQESLSETTTKLNESLVNLARTEEKLFNTEKQLDESNVKLNERVEALAKVESELNKKINEINRCESDLNEQRKRYESDFKSLEETYKTQQTMLITKYEKTLETKCKELQEDEASKQIQLKQSFESKLEQLKKEYDLMKQVNDQLNKSLNELNEKFELAKQNWTQERGQIINRKDEELQKCMQQLEKRFEEDYSKFVQSHKETIHRALSEKAAEHVKDKEKLIDLYEKKINELETQEKTQSKQIRELKEKLSTITITNTNTSTKATSPRLATNNTRLSIGLQTKLTPNLVDAKTQTESTQQQLTESKPTTQNDSSLFNNITSHAESSDKIEYINSLLEKIRSLEEVISNTDVHFEQELDKLRQELEEDYQLKLKYELEREEVNRKQMELEMDSLRNQLQIKSSNSSGSGHNTSNYNSDNSSIMADNSENGMTDLDYNYQTTTTTTKHQNPPRLKYSKLKQELNVKEKEIETVEHAYRIRIEQMQEKFDEHLRQMKSKYELDLNRAKVDLNDNYKMALTKSKNEIEQMQVFVQKLKKANMDSDRVIESLKLEMNKIKENHLNELTTLKMSSEREKETLKEKCENSMQRVSSLEKQLVECEERLKKQCDLLRAELKQEYGIELSKMNNKMKDMMKSHANAVDLLKKQHQNAKQNTALLITKSSQTETSSKDIELLETFRQKYLETLTRMKSDMMKEFDAQTVRVSERVNRQINEERTLIKEKLNAILIPKIVDILREYRISEKIIESKISEYERDLAQITSTINPVKKNVSSSLGTTTSTCTGTATSATSSQLNSQIGSSNEISDVNEAKKLNKFNDLVSPLKDLDYNSRTSSSNHQQYAHNNLTNTNGLYAQTNQSAKRSASALTTVRPSPNKNNDNLTNLQLYSKSATSMRDYSSQQQQQPTTIVTNLISNKLDSLDNLSDSSKKIYQQQNESQSKSSTSAATAAAAATSAPLTSLSTGGYKYTPLRQSWSNLSQMNQLSPYSLNSPSVVCENPTNRRTLFEPNETVDESRELNIHHPIESASVISPTIQRATATSLVNRPLTADSIYKRTAVATKLTTADFDNANELTASSNLHHISSKNFYSKHQHHTNANNERDERLALDNDCVEVDEEYLDSNNEDDLNDLKVDFNKKYRTQNIRLKKSQKPTKQDQRPHSASNLPSSSSYAVSSSSTSTSNSQSVNTKNPISTLYEMSKNYKSIEQFEPDKANTLTKQSGSVMTTSTSSKVSSDPINRRTLAGTDNELNNTGKPRVVLSIYKSNEQLINSNYDVESDQTPIKLGSELTMQNKKTFRSASTILNSQNPARSLSSLGSKLSTNNPNPSSYGPSTTTTTNTNSTTNQQTTTSLAAFTSNSLPRSRTPTSSNAQTNIEQIGGTHSYRNATVASSAKKNGVTSSNQEINSNGIYASSINNQYPISSASTQYHPINNSLTTSTTNLAKSTNLTQKKKSVFY